MIKLSGQYYEFESFRLYASERILRRIDNGGGSVPLTPRVFDILVALIENRGRVVTRQQLLQQVWDDSFVEEANLTVSVSMLRKALGTRVNGESYIETVPKRGYCFVAPVQEITTEEEKVHSAVNLGGREKTTSALAVMPFVNATTDPQAEYLSDVITESIINNLSQIPSLLVMASQTVFRYKGQQVDAREVGLDLNVNAVLTGRFLRLGEKLIVRTELIKAADNSHLWGEQYECLPADILAVQEKIAREISEKLRLKLTTQESRLLSKRHTESSEAYQLYLEGRYFWNKYTDEGLQKAIEKFQQAIGQDPKYALAYAGIADCYNNLSVSIFGIHPPRAIFPKAKEAATKALEIDDTLAEAHAALAFALMVSDREWVGAEQEFKQAIKHNSGYATAHQWHSFLLSATGHTGEGVKESKRALEIDPLSLMMNTNVAYALYLARQYDQALEQCLKTLEMEPQFLMALWGLAWIYMLKGMYEKAIATANKAVALTGGDPLSLATLGHTLAMAGKHVEAKRVLNKLKQLAEKRYVSPHYVSLIYAGLNERDEAFKWLEVSCENRDFWAIWLLVEPRFDPLRSDSRFNDLLRRLRLA